MSTNLRLLTGHINQTILEDIADAINFKLKEENEENKYKIQPGAMADLILSIPLEIDQNLKAENIKKGIEVIPQEAEPVIGTFEGYITNPSETTKYLFRSAENGIIAFYISNQDGLFKTEQVNAKEDLIIYPIPGTTVTIGGLGPLQAPMNKDLIQSLSEGRVYQLIAEPLADMIIEFGEFDPRLKAPNIEKKFIGTAPEMTAVLLSWKPIEEAINYQYRINGGDWLVTTNTEISIGYNSLGLENNIIEFQTIAENAELSSEIISVVVKQAPAPTITVGASTIIFKGKEGTALKYKKGNYGAYNIIEWNPPNASINRPNSSTTYYAYCIASPNTTTDVLRSKEKNRYVASLIDTRKFSVYTTPNLSGNINYKNNGVSKDTAISTSNQSYGPSVDPNSTIIITTNELAQVKSASAGYNCDSEKGYRFECQISGDYSSYSINLDDFIQEVNIHGYSHSPSTQAFALKITSNRNQDVELRINGKYCGDGSLTKGENTFGFYYGFLEDGENIFRITPIKINEDYTIKEDSYTLTIEKG